MRSKLFVVILTMVILVGLFTLMLTNSEVRENIRNGLDAFGNNFNSEDSVNEEIDLQADTQVFEDGSAILTDDSAIVETVDISSKITGTGPFDDNDEPGNDSSESNNIVRSFDTVTWNLEATTALNRTGHGSEDVNTYSQFRGGVIYVEAKLPEENAGLMKWSLDDMTWAGDTGVLSDDGLTFTGQYEMSDEIITVPGKQTLSLVLKVEGAGNGSTFAPTFRVWMQGNETNPDNEGYEAKEIQDTDPVTVSAKAGFNIKLVKSSRFTPKVSVDFNDGNGEVTGRMYGFGILLQLYNEDVEKGLKGLEYPQGDITFDIETKLEAIETIDGKQVTTDITNLATPRLWNYRVNIGTLSQNPLYGNIPDRNMYFGRYTGYDDASLPYGMYRETSQEGMIYNSGKILAQENGNVINATISDYEFNGVFPKYDAYYTLGQAVDYGENVGCFSAGVFQIFVPDNKETTNENRTYYLTVEDENMYVSTLSSQETTEQVITNDDTNNLEHEISKAVYKHSIEIIKANGDYFGGNSSTSNLGKIAITKNQMFQIRLKIHQDSDNDLGTEIKSVNKLVKFDGDGIEPVVQENGEKAIFDTDTMTWKIWYVTKKDGTNWVDEAERNNSNIEDLSLYENLEDIPKGYICIGMYFESQGGMLNIPSGITYSSIMVKMKAKDTSEIGKTYGIMQDDDYWNVTLDRTTQTALNPDAEYPETVWSIHNQPYVKTQYDENGQVITGTHYGGVTYGNTVLVVGADSSISTRTIDSETGEEKTTYDIGKNENEVTLQITPKLSESDPQIPTNIKGATVRIKETLPKELTYVPGSSNYGEPIETIQNDDGTTTYIWEIYNCNVGEAIEPLVIKAELDPETANGTTLKVTSLIEPDKELIGLSSLELRTTTNEINVVNLASYRIYQETDTQIIENNGEIKYKLTFQNSSTTSMPDFQVLDILPYNGDGRGTAYNGTYTLKDVKVTQTLGGSVIENSNLKLYTTTNIDARKITPKDEGIGVSEIWIEKTIGEAINELVTVIALKGEVANNATVEIEITLQTSNNRGGDIYYNQATAQTSKNTEVITTSNVKTEVVKRQISGMIWYDTNENGIKDEEENYANRIEVELKKADGSKAQDYNGNEIENILTDSNGTYTFSNLPMGEYIVEIKTEDKYKLTQANVGSNKEINSKFEETEEGTKQSYTITNLNGIQSPEILENNVNAGLVVKDAKIIVNYLIEDATPDTDEDNTELVASKEITTYEKEGETYKYKIGDSYNTYAEEVEDWC